MKFLTVLLAVAAQLPALAWAGSAAEWKSRNIYFALTDRIARSSDDQGGSSCGNLGNYCGGTWKGLEGKLDYIKGMGFNAIWITPVVTNSDGGYHGYWATDLYGTNDHYGSAQDLKDLVSAAHSKYLFVTMFYCTHAYLYLKGIWVMVDVVANHMASGDISSYSPDPLNQNWAYNSQCEINYGSQASVESCWIAGLPDINTKDETVRNMLQNWINWLVQEYGFDGVRVDTVKHVEKDFWPPFASAAGVYTIGEVWDGGIDFLSGYDNLLGGLLNYAVYYPMNRFYMQQGSSQDLVDMINTVGSRFSDPTTLGSFLDNHDNNRWLNQKSDTSLFQNALAFVILARGIPIIYYGSEQGYDGGSDPANREDLWRSGFNTDTNLYKAIATLSEVRAEAGGLPNNDHVHLSVDDTSYAWCRNNCDVVVMTVNSGSGSSGQRCFNTQRSNGYYNVRFGGSGYLTSDANGWLCVNISNGLPVVLTART
ncbi:alpha-amylase [Geosmithia morbida]|uniref:Alpha-amylase n=1 Tax=Geosmithia morbida TaxID=1094350 RepID=A0A9P4YRR0_9HYPO|nr:alpha-amylase [Geosmithia morbida]KAF4120865.1 alpha-amylase [Geosmithia morbida]